jgi:hypothetical protein
MDCFNEDGTYTDLAITIDSDLANSLRLIFIRYCSQVSVRNLQLLAHNAVYDAGLEILLTDKQADLRVPLA